MKKSLSVVTNEPDLFATCRYILLLVVLLWKAFLLSGVQRSFRLTTLTTLWEYNYVQNLTADSNGGDYKTKELDCVTKSRVQQ